VDLMSSRGKLDAKLGGDNPASPVRGVTGDADLASRCCHRQGRKLRTMLLEAEQPGFHASPALYALRAHTLVRMRF